ncbi:MAG: beta-phosphoglucomutase [Agathobacter sp.]|jgi:beta-phosphoglucomutase|nr:beta-phosphoglucomutase [Agathobacter sp.]
MIKGVIFDLDGVLVSTDEMHYQAWKRLAQELHITGFTREDNRRQRGVSRMASLEIVLEKADRTYSEEEKIELAERKNGYYLELLEEMDESSVLENVKDVLEKLKNGGLLLAVGSASKNAPVILEKTGLMPYFDKISCGLDTTKSKPDPEVFLVAAKKLGLPPEECLVVEDSAAGIEAAAAGGMKSLGVGPFYQSLHADYEAPALCKVEDWESIL